VSELGIDSRIAELLAEKGWASLNELQIRSMEVIKRGDNVLISAPTGSGKTEAALIPLLDEMLKSEPQPVAGLYITPMRALINDVYVRVKWWASRLGFSVSRKHGEVSQREKALRNRVKPHILVLTPESLKIDLDWAPKFRDNYRGVKWVVVDEVHEIAGSKRGAQLSLLLERLRKLYSIDPQVIALSATVGSPSRVLELLSGSSKRRRTVLQHGGARRLSVEIEYLDVSGLASDDYWKRLSASVAREIEPVTLVFVHSRYAAERLLKEIQALGLKEVAVHHSSVSGEIKESIESDMRSGRLKGVITTRTLELGIDMGFVKKVVIVGSPGSALSLLQKIGRSGHREGEESRGVIIATSSAELLEGVAAAENAVEGIIEPTKAVSCPLDVVAREALGLALSGLEVTPELVHGLARDSGVCEGLSEEQAARLLEHLASRNMLKRGERGYVLSPGFFRIWSFAKERKWWSRNFTEFFTVVSDSDIFQVKAGETTIGELDAQFVYRYLRVGDTIRLAGGSWKVVEIDENSKRVGVAQAPRDASEVPIWRGIPQVASDEVVARVRAILRRGPSSPAVVLREGAKARLEALREEWARLSASGEAGRIWVFNGGDHVTVVTFMGQRVNEGLGLLAMSALSKVTTDVSLQITPYAVKIRPSVDILELARAFRCYGELKRELSRAAERHPLYAIIRNEIKYSLGLVGDASDNAKEFVREEASRQLLDYYVDVDGLWALLESLRSGSIAVEERPLTEAPSFIREGVSHALEVRPWYRDVSLALQRLLKGWAFTVDEIAEALMLPARVVERKLREMRKPGGKVRLARFIDVETGEHRWCLADDLPELAESPEFSESFKPADLKQPFLLKIKSSGGDGYLEVIVTPSIDAIRDQISKVPGDELLEMRVQPLLDGIYKNLSPRYYFVRKDLAPLLALNGMAYLQRVKDAL